ERLLAPIVVRGASPIAAGSFTANAASGIPAPAVLLGSANISISGNIQANSTTAAGGVVILASSQGTVTTQTVDATGTTGGSILIAGATGVSIPNSSPAQGYSLLADSLSNQANGGDIFLASPGGTISF